jgi:hypothetical protein
VIGAQNAVAAARRDLESKQRAAEPKVEALYAALTEAKWPQILAAAEALLSSIPEHPAGRQARARAWQQIAAIGPSGASQWPQRGARAAQVSSTDGLSAENQDQASPGVECRPEPAPLPSSLSSGETDGIVWLTAGGDGPVSLVVPRPSPPRVPLFAPPRPLVRTESTGPRGRFLLWVDAVGGYLVCLDDRIVLGRAGPDSPADVPLMGDLARAHATLVRSGESYMLQARHSSFVNGKLVADQTVLCDGDVIRLGSTVELEIRQPSPVSATARLAIVSRHRLPLAVDGVLLMAETCIVGGTGQAHIPSAAIKEPVVLYRQGSALWCRATGSFDVDGQICAGRAPLTLQSSVLGDGFSFSLEPLRSHSV